MTTRSRASQARRKPRRPSGSGRSGADSDADCDLSFRTFLKVVTVELPGAPAPAVELSRAPDGELLRASACAGLPWRPALEPADGMSFGTSFFAELSRGAAGELSCAGPGSPCGPALEVTADLSLGPAFSGPPSSGARPAQAAIASVAASASARGPLRPAWHRVLRWRPGTSTS